METKARRLARTLMERARARARERFAQGTADASDNDRLHQYLAVERNYRKVWRGALQPQSWYPRRSRRGSVPFLVNALGHVGVEIPADERIGGLEIARFTSALSSHLQEARGWQRIERSQELRPGDVVFTRDAPCCVGIPDHVFVFMGWSDRERDIALAVDDQGHTHARPLFPRERPELGHAALTAFSYGLRATAEQRPTDAR